MLILGRTSGQRAAGLPHAETRFQLSDGFELLILLNYLMISYNIDLISTKQPMFIASINCNIQLMEVLQSLYE